MRVRRLPAEDVALVASIDRSEHVDVEYRVIAGQLQQVPAVITDVPAWDPNLHLSRPYRRKGVAQALWNVAVDIAVADGAESMYVSATPTGSAVGFYLRQGCRVAQPVHPELFAEEPEDIHLVCPLK